MVFAAFCAGTVDAIAGGGGLLTVPALLAVGLPPHLALGTNKGQSVFGSAAALARFARAGLVDPKRARWTFPLGLLGSAGGAALVLVMRPEDLRPVVLVLLILAAAVMTFRPSTPPVDAPKQILHPVGRAVAIAGVVGCYDGFFGPGTGTFLILLFVSLLGDSLRSASANAKVVNFASNVAALAVFAFRGSILWSVALPMAVGQFAGGFVGAHLTVKGGEKRVRYVVLGVVFALVLKVGSDFYRSHG